MNFNIDIDNIPVTQLQSMFPAMTPEQRKAAKAILRARTAESFDALQDEWRVKQMPSKMKKPVAVQIANMRGDYACGGLRIVEERVPGHTKIVPGDIVCVDMTWESVRGYLAKGFLQLCSDPVNRPLVYEDKFTAETFHVGRRNTSSENERARIQVCEERRIADAQKIQMELDEIRSEGGKAPTPNDALLIDQMHALEIQLETLRAKAGLRTDEPKTEGSEVEPSAPAETEDASEGESIGGVATVTRRRKRAQ